MLDALEETIKGITVYLDLGLRDESITHDEAMKWSQAVMNLTNARASILSHPAPEEAWGAVL